MMRKYFFLSLIATFAAVINVSAQDNSYNMIVKMANGTTITIDTNDVDSVTFNNGEITATGKNLRILMTQTDSLLMSFKEEFYSAIKMLQAETEMQNQKINALKAENAECQERMKALEYYVMGLQDSITKINQRIDYYHSGENGDNNNQNNGKVIYQSPSGEVYTCNGVYATYGNGYNNCICFETNLQDLNRNHFKISFDYTPEESGWLIVLSESSRVLGLIMRSDGKIRVTTNNQDNSYATNVSYQLGVLQHIDMEYNNGTLNLNGEQIEVAMYEDHGDNKLTTLNYSNGGAYKGTIQNIVVTSY